MNNTLLNYIMTQVLDYKTPLVFKVTKRNLELIVPANPTPYELKELSDIDDQPHFRAFVSGIQFYKSSPSGLDPVKVIKEALGKALVAYYPLAGRLRETEKGRLVVECNGEGVLFIEANADVTLDDFGEPIFPPFPCMEELFYDFHNPLGVFDCPLFIIQVTRLKCGGLICAHKINHVIVDGTGFAQFLQAVAELARGVEFPSTHPVWDRHLLQARNPPQVTCLHHGYEIDNIKNNNIITPLNDMVHKCFSFGPMEIAAIRRLLPAHLKSSSTFEVVIACIWRSRTIAMQLNPNDEVRLKFYVNARHKFNPPLPKGYYGNVVATPMAISIVYDLVSNPLAYTLDLIKCAKGIVTEEYMKSLADFIATKGRPQPQLNDIRTYIVSDLTRVGFEQWDFGWGNAIFGGPVKVWLGGSIPGFGNFILASKSSTNESVIMVPMCLPRLVMDRFVIELNENLSVGEGRL